MEIIGLTGSIGMGKSATANMLRMLGIPVFDSDACVHALLGKKGAAAPLVREKFPDCWKESKSRSDGNIEGHVEGHIDRQILGRLVFHDKLAKQALEEILHPLVWQAQKQFLAKCRRAGHKQVVLDIPLLFETGSHRKCDRIICVTAPTFVQQQRVLKRPGMTSQKLAAILDGQLPDLHKRLQSDHVIHTGLGRSYTLQSLKKALRYPLQETEEPNI